MKPFLDLSHIAVDPNLAQQLPPGVARYYEALPIAREGDSVTVAMSHPENVTALAVLTQFFRAQIVPIRTDGAAVHAALQQLYSGETAQTHGILAWLPAATEPAWRAMMADYGLASEEFPMTWLDAEQIDAQTLLASVQGGNYRLTLCALPEVAIQSALLRDIHSPLWLAPEEPVLPRRILLVLRGYASDEVALTWVVQLTQQVENAAVALLPIMGQAPWGALSYLQQPGLVQGHITESALRLAEKGIQPTLTLQSGEPHQQVIQAVRHGSYDLMVIAAEGYGQFVGQLLADLEEKCTLPPGGVLIVKPNRNPS